MTLYPKFKYPLEMNIDTCCNEIESNAVLYYTNTYKIIPLFEWVR